MRHSMRHSASPSGQALEWSSGYDICFTRRGSPVRLRVLAFCSASAANRVLRIYRIYGTSDLYCKQKDARVSFQRSATIIKCGIALFLF